MKGGYGLFGCCMSFKVRSELYENAAGNEGDALHKILREDKGDGVVISSGDVVKQKVAIHHVVHRIYSYAPVKVQLLKYPKSSKKYGQEYIWICMNDDAVDTIEKCDSDEVKDVIPQIGNANWEKRKLDFPPGVSIDSQGNIYVAGNSGMPARSISSSDVMAGFYKPPKPAAPKVTETHPESLQLCWEPVLGLVEAYEIQYKVIDEGHRCVQCGEEINDVTEGQVCPKCGSEIEVQAAQAGLSSTTWYTVRTVDAAKVGCQSTIDCIQCNVPYVFRVRARNEVGFSDYSDASPPEKTLPEKPDVPDKPILITSFENSIAMKWKKPAANGAAIVLYRVRGGPISSRMDDSEGVEPLPVVYEGAQNFVVFTKLRPERAHQYQVSAENAVGQSSFGEPDMFKTTQSPRDDSTEKVYRQEWFEVWDGFSSQKIYLNARSGKQLLERPAEMDGPVDFMVEFKKARFRFLRELLADAPKGGLDVNRLKINRDNLVDDSFAALRSLPKEELVKKIRIDFIGEEGIDSGGLCKDWFLEMSRGIFRPDLGLFVELNDTNTFEIDKDCVLTEEKEELYFLVGLFLGKAIFDRQLIDIRLSPLLLKQLIGYEVNIDDLQESDPEFVKSMNWMLENDIEDIIYEEFAVTVKDSSAADGPKYIIHDLIPGGRNIEVTNENKELYVEKKMEWRAVGSMKRQVESLQRGLFQVVPQRLLSQFVVKELELLWNGNPEIDLVALRGMTKYQGDIDINSEIVQWFWKVFKDLDKEHTGLLLRFITGTSKIPLDGFDPPFNITYSPDKDPQSLPEAHTCFNQVVLPQYADSETLRQKLIFAINNAVGFGRS